jgi:hypothetical protein
MMGGAVDQWPDALFFGGDQVYADDPSPALKQRLRRLQEMGARPLGPDGAEVSEEIVDFEEYTWLYQESWRTPGVRWLLSTVPTAMILDDHDLRDDWNSSWSWRQEMTRKSWWRRRVEGALASYWVYQHLGNLSPEQLAKDEIYAAVRDAPDGPARERVLADFAWAADQTPDVARWSFVRDFGRSRLLVVDSRCSRHLDPDDRTMVDDVEWDWFTEQASADVDHLLIGTSLPVLLLHGVHHMEGLDEATAEGAWGPVGSRVGEKVRLALDLEHWAAFRRSFDAMIDLVRAVARRDAPPASVVWLSGDVHCSYTATADVEGAHDVSVHQLTMSPFRNPLEPWVRVANRLLERPGVARFLARLARRAGVVEPGVTWDVDHGPWFDNGVMTVVVEGRRIGVEVEHARVEHGHQVLERTLTHWLN